ncbi:MAG TPA: 4-hydroxy-tetrahydrodipicolinate synthase [Planctomycetota bacterium]|nr:4-hydroxy-tetrahydrodipicolinate synthase [Planctomycetota bacterium]
MFKGSIVALVTPFKNGGIDRKALDGLLDFHLANGSDGIVPAGTTGEAPTLTAEEFVELVKAVKARCAGKIPVIAGVGTNSTAKTVHNAKTAAEAGADALLVVSPYYNKPTQRGLQLHFEAVAGATKLPMVLYNIPGRTGVNISPETMALLAKTRNIVAVKEAAGSIEQVMQVRAGCDLTILSGDDALTYPMMTLGAVGVISVAANIVPKEIAHLCRLANSGELAGARAVHERLARLFKILFIETNPIPVKTALKLMGKCGGDLRLPMCPMAPENEEKLRAVLKEYRLV